MKYNRNKNLIKFLALCAIGASFILPGREVFAQLNEGSLAGTVTDQTGAAVPDAALVLTNEETRQVAKAETTMDGYYRFPQLPVGTYTVSVSKPGFQTQRSTGVVIQIQTTTTLDVALLVGSVTQTMTVAASSLKVQTESTDVGTVVTPQEVQDLPLSIASGAMRDLTTFAFLSPATYGVGTTGGSFLAGLAGGATFGGEILFDGASLQAQSFGDGWNNEILPSVDAVQEFKVFIAGVPAEYGRTGGGIQSYTTKSGTNVFHGSAYEIFRNTDLDANNWFNNAEGLPVPADMKDEYGFTFGGPAWIPKVYDGRNKTFFFVSWEQFRQHEGYPNLVTVPTNDNRAGNFSAQLTNTVLGTNPCNDQPIYAGEIFDPSTTQVVNGVQCRDPFPGNIITTGFSKAAENILQYIPTPTNASTVNNFSFLGSIPYIDTTYTIRADHNFSSSDKFFASFSNRGNLRGLTQSGVIPLPFTTGFTRDQNVTANIARVGYDHVFSPTLLNHLHVGFARFLNPEFYTHAVNGTGKNYDSLLGIPGGGGPLFPGLLFEEGSMVNMGDLGSPYYNAGYNSKVSDNSYEIADDVALEKGRHSLMVGVDYRYMLAISSYLDNLNGSFVFGRALTAGDQLQESESGNGFASFLLGQVAQGYAVRNLVGLRNLGHYAAAYVQDEYKVTPHLNLSLGLRYSLDVPVREEHDNSSQFDPSLTNPATGTLGALIFSGIGPGRSGLNSRWAKPYYGDIEPRIGFAYTPFGSGKTVLQGNYGMISSPLTAWTQTYNGVPYGFSSYAFVNNTATAGYRPAEVLDTGGVPQPAGTINLDPTQANGSSVPYAQRDFGRPGMTQTWSFTVQRELAPDLIMTLGYIGQHGVHLPSGLEMPNDLNPEHFGMGSVLSQNIVGNTANVPLPYPGFAGSVAQALRAYPQYLTIMPYESGENIGVSRYEALTAKLERRFRNGLTLLAAYTWSKNLTDVTQQVSWGTNAQNPFNRKGEISYAPQDVPQILSLNYVYALPFGKGKKFLNGNNLLDKLVGGWSFASVQRYQSGQPIQFGCATGVPGFDNCINWNLVAPASQIESSARRGGSFNPFAGNWYNTACTGATTSNCVFADPNSGSVISSGGGYSFGNMARYYSSNRYFPYFDEDFALIKVTPLTEKVKLRFRAEAFNAFNRVEFGGPDSEPYDGPAFGTVGSQMNSPRQVQFTLRFEF